MKNQNQNSSNKRYKLYINVDEWNTGVLYDTNTDECCGVDNNLLFYIEEFCIGKHRYNRYKNYNNFHERKYIEFDSYEDFKQLYPELLI